MSVFSYELKKIWNWKALLAIVAVFIMAYLFRFNWYTQAYNNARSIFSGYTDELWSKYGDTLDSREYADFGYEEREAELIERINANPDESGEGTTRAILEPAKRAAILETGRAAANR
ncbi:hypothetical protein FACS1894184_02930 [Clostridia bacterium]|nr:hypothetical protein FACS1894184_02930 [Clostridia bacterium]